MVAVSGPWVQFPVTTIILSYSLFIKFSIYLVYMYVCTCIKYEQMCAAYPKKWMYTLYNYHCTHPTQIHNHPTLCGMCRLHVFRFETNICCSYMRILSHYLAIFYRQQVKIYIWKAKQSLDNTFLWLPILR